MTYKYVDKDLEDYIINHRRHFHQNPELSWQEENTSDYILKELEKLGIEAVSYTHLTLPTNREV